MSIWFQVYDDNTSIQTTTLSGEGKSMVFQYAAQVY